MEIKKTLELFAYAERSLTRYRIELEELVSAYRILLNQYDNYQGKVSAAYENIIRASKLSTQNILSTIQNITNDVAELNKDLWDGVKVIQKENEANYKGDKEAELLEKIERIKQELQGTKIESIIY